MITHNIPKNFKPCMTDTEPGGKSVFTKFFTLEYIEKHFNILPNEDIVSISDEEFETSSTSDTRNLKYF